ncbi:putative spindle pole body-associated protein sad1 [Diplodia seriata]|nr:putative spindle pole body-associated protein sad1 [Diplodia seriata]
MPRSRASSAALPDMATPRRSTRIASRTPSVAGSDAGSDAGDRRNDRASMTPTNAGHVGRLVTTRPAGSRAYGATGLDSRASTPPEMAEAPTIQEGFAASFSRHRERAHVSVPRTITENDETVRIPPTIPEARETSSPLKKSSSVHTSSRRSTSSHHSAHTSSRIPNQPAAPNDEGHPVSNNSRTPTQPAALNDDVPVSNTNQIRSPSAAPNDDSRPATRDTNESSFLPTKSWHDLREAAFVGWAHYSPAWYDIARRIMRNYLAPIFSVMSIVSKFSALALGFLSAIFFLYLLLDVSFKSVFVRNTTAAAYMRESSLKVINIVTGFDSVNQPFPVIGEGSKIDYLSNKIAQVDKGFGIVKEDLEYLHSKLPEWVMLTHNPKTGRTEIPGAFWHALRDNLAKEGITTGNRGDSPSWTNFWQNNKAHMDAYLSDAIDTKLKDAIQKNAPVDRETFIGMVQDRYQLLETHVADMESSWNRKLDSKLKDFVAALPKGQLDTMANNLLLENAWTALHAVNFFSRSLGAVVDPHLTSPTMASRGLARRALQKLTWIPGDLPPAAALVAWEEPTDCWCAARSPGSGKAQIGVIMPYKIVPETLLVEHIPRDGTLDIGSAPRGMEVWVEVEDEGVRAAFPAIEDRPREKFVRVGSFEYKVDALNHVQAFNLNSELLTPVNKVVVRVTGTWGRDWTCLYRLRMNGRPVDEFNGYSE